jgi:hypothetical protein
MKTISILLALVNSLIAGLLMAYNLSGVEIGQPAFLWSLAKISAALAVIAVGLLTWLANVRTMITSLMTLGNIFLISLGAATIVWTYHVATFAGRMEFHMIFFGGSLMMQGMASLLAPRSQSQAITAPQS